MTDISAEFDAAFEATPDGADDMGLGELGPNATILTGEDSNLDFTPTNDDDDSDIDEVPDGDDDDSGTETDVTESPDGDTLSQVFDWATHKDDPVIIKVAGEDVQVPLGEALAGYMRQADYTRKTQLLVEDRKYADWARDMQRAFQTDPQGTLKALQQAFGADEADDPYTDLEPEVAEKMRHQDRQLAALQANWERVEQDRVLNEVKAEIAAIKDEFPDFDPQKVLPLASDRGLPIRDAYLILRAQETVAREKAEATAKAKAQEKAQIEAKKRTAGRKVATGGSAVKAGVSKVPQMDSFADMLAWGFDNSGDD